MWYIIAIDHLTLSLKEKAKIYLQLFIEYKLFKRLIVVQEEIFIEISHNKQGIYCKTRTGGLNI